MHYRKGEKQGGLFDYQDHLARLAQRGGALEVLNKTVDWEVFRKDLEEVLSYADRSKGGRPPWDPVLMLKVLVLQKYHGLSDDQVEFQIDDRYSFQRFLGLHAGDRAPDAKTVWLFKERLGEAGMKRLFERFDGEIRLRGLIGTQGKILDASFVEAPRQRNSREDNQTIKTGSRPESFDENPHRGRQKDTDARWTKKNEETHFGYKNHAKVDATSKVIEAYQVSAANQHDSQALPQLACASDGAMFADSAYCSQEHEQLLEGLKIENFIHLKGVRGRPLTEGQQEINRLKSKIRARVEHVFGRLAQMGADHFRRVGIQRARFEIGLGNLVYNMTRVGQITSKA